MGEPAGCDYPRYYILAYQVIHPRKRKDSLHLHPRPHPPPDILKRGLLGWLGSHVNPPKPTSLALPALTSTGCVMVKANHIRGFMGNNIFFRRRGHYKQSLAAFGPPLQPTITTTCPFCYLNASPGGAEPEWNSPPRLVWCESVPCINPLATMLPFPQQMTKEETRLGSGVGLGKP